jgi:two-component system, chemotaxis family, CheB/CheR fusion protein
MNVSVPSPVDYRAMPAALPPGRFLKGMAFSANTTMEWPSEIVTTPTGGLDAMMASSTNAMLLLSSSRRILRFTPAATALFSLLPGDVGRPIHDLSQHFTDPSFLSDIMLVLDGRNASKKRVESEEGRWFVRQTMRCGLRGGTVDSVLITFSEVEGGTQDEARLSVAIPADSKRHAETQDTESTGSRPTPCVR